MKAEIAVIGGTGLYDPKMLSGAKEEVISTAYGDAEMVIGSLGEKRIAFVSRHGKEHTVPPHLVNYRANIRALYDIGVERIFATASAGSLNLDMGPGELVILDQFIDFTKNRPLTFFDGGKAGVVHTDMTEPYCSELRSLLIAAGDSVGVQVHPSGTYVCAEGPRFETASEINMYKILDGDLVGMTNVPEVVLARELGMCYSTVGVVTNFAAGISDTMLSHSEVLEVMSKNVKHIQELIQIAVSSVPDERNCDCQNAADKH